MEIGIIIAIILVMFALALTRSKTGQGVKELARLAGTAFGLSLVILAALWPPRSPRTAF